MNTFSPLPLNAVQLVKEYLLQLQAHYCSSLETFEENARFNSDLWERENGGGGITRVLTNGQVFAKAGVNFSHVFGDALPAAASAARPELKGRRFNALGVSVVLHPDNPMIPTTHANVRFIIAEAENTPPIWWFGGGFDLTPYYPFDEDCVHWHSVAKAACTPFDAQYYSRFKQSCDNYFYLKHRQEARGIGGLFFDDFNELGFEKSFAFMQSIGNHFMPAYLPIVQKRQNLPFGEREKAFQLYRRGRYVEFNLVYDRGTLFGLQAGGRIESILMSLPPEVHWHYNWEAEPHSPEAELSAYLCARDWV